MALVKSTADIKRYAPQFSKNMSFDTLLPLAELAEMTYIIPFIGQAFYDELNAAYADSPTEDQTKIIEKLQRCLSFYISYEASKSIGIQITDSGTLENSADNSSPARQWMQNMSMKSSAVNGDRFFDLALSFLETNKGKYPTWTSSDEYTVSKKYFINTTSVFSQFVNIGDSRRAFLQIRPFIQLAEEKYFIPTIGQELFSQLKTEILAGTLTDANKTLLDNYIQRPLAHLAFSEAAPNLIIEVSGSGVRVLSTADGINQSKEANDKQVYNMIDSNKLNGESYLGRLKKFLDDNASDYPLYGNSESFENGQPRTELPDNTCKKSFMV